MMSLKPERIYVTKNVLQSSAAEKRTRRMIAAMDPGSVEWVTYEELDRMVADGRWDDISHWGAEETPRDPDVVLTMASFPSDEERERIKERYPHLGTRDMWGFQTFTYRCDGDPDFRERSRGIICQSAWELHTILGCPFRCSYCGLGGVVRVLVNIEEYVDHLDEWFEVAPDQRLYKWDNVTDIPCFEPEYDASRLLVERFAEESDRFLEIYAGKSANTDYLLDYDHRGQTILQWSVSGRSQQEHFEQRTDGMVERLEAARKCQEAGYIVRFRLSPIIPVRDWREENRELLEEMFARTRPDVVSLCPFGWMDVERAERLLDFDLLDPPFVEGMRAMAPFLEERGYTLGSGRPMPHEMRYVMLNFLIDEIQRISPETTIALCLETEEMWRALGPRIGQAPGNYVCNCGPTCAPGDSLYEAKTRRGMATRQEKPDAC
jgi:spore photoproduct lyase